MSMIEGKVLLRHASFFSIPRGWPSFFTLRLYSSSRNKRRGLAMTIYFLFSALQIRQSSGCDESLKVGAFPLPGWLEWTWI